MAMRSTLSATVETILVDVLDAILTRYERDPGSPYIDTKLDIVTGRDFAPDGPEFTRKHIIYPWIQGRGLESLAGHLRWLPSCSVLDADRKASWQRRIAKVLREVSGSMETLRRTKGGRLHFMVTPDGRFLGVEDGCRLVPLAQPPPPGSNFSDLFYSKGLMAAAACLDDRPLLDVASRYFSQVLDDILAGDRFMSDQQAFDPKNKVAHVPGRILQGPKMIALSGCAIGMACLGPVPWEQRSRVLIERVLREHVNVDGERGGLERFDFWEGVDAEGRPWTVGGTLLCDPGHALEFIGLSVKNLLAMRHSGDPEIRRFVEGLVPLYPAFLRHNFGIGFACKAGGIVKAYDLLARRPVNTDMPWWSLPETIRAAALATEFAGDDSLADILVAAAEAFLGNYLNPAAHNMAYQTRNAAGAVVPVIPATPDADPGYHTGLSLIDALPTLKRLGL
jgi:mannose/cellobiose epimerase-like protein (N-acyl-D-glucosamine 2-epimerase family)